MSNLHPVFEQALRPFAPSVSVVKQLAEYERSEGYGSDFYAVTTLGEKEVSIYFNTDSEGDPVDLHIWHADKEVTSTMTPAQLIQCIDACEKALPRQLKGYNDDMLIARTA